MTTSSNRPLANRIGGMLPLIAVTIVALAIVGGIVWALGSNSQGDAIQPILSQVTSGEFVANVLDTGEIQSAENQEIVCQVGSRTGSVTVIDVIPEGTKVKGGDWLITLDSEGFEKELEQQRISVTSAETAVIQADAAYNAAVASKKEYEEGIFVESQQTINNAILSAEQELEQAEAVFAHSQNLFRKGYMTKQQLRGDEIQVSKAKNSLDLARQQLYVLEEITYKKEMQLLESDIKAAKVKWDNEVKAQKIEQEQLAEIERQLQHCEIHVPEGVSGEVVFAKEFDRRGGSEWVLEPGAEVRERQVLIQLPNRDKMEVKVLVNEQSITAIEAGMPASINVDAFNNKSLKGYVSKVNQYAEQGGMWSSSAVNEFAVYVRIVDPPKELIPGMNASVSIQTMYEKTAVQAPIQCVYAVNDQLFALRKNGEKDYETVEVTVGGENSQNVWITSGVNVDDELVMNPGAYKDMMDLPEVVGNERIEIPEGAGMTSEQSGDSQGGSGERRGRGDRGGDRGDRGEGGGQRGGGDRGQRGGGGSGGFDVNRIIDMTMERYDTNGDGKIDAEEQEEFDDRAARMKDADKDGDGAISRDEAKAYMEEMMKRFQGGGGTP